MLNTPHKEHEQMNDLSHFWLPKLGQRFRSSSQGLTRMHTCNRHNNIGIVIQHWWCCLQLKKTSPVPRTLAILAIAFEADEGSREVSLSDKRKSCWIHILQPCEQDLFAYSDCNAVGGRLALVCDIWWPSDFSRPLLYCECVWTLAFLVPSWRGACYARHFIWSGQKWIGLYKMLLVMVLKEGRGSPKSQESSQDFIKLSNE